MFFFYRLWTQHLGAWIIFDGKHADPSVPSPIVLLLRRQNVNGEGGERIDRYCTLGSAGPHFAAYTLLLHVFMAMMELAIHTLLLWWPKGRVISMKSYQPITWTPRIARMGIGDDEMGVPTPTTALHRSRTLFCMASGKAVLAVRRAW